MGDSKPVPNLSNAVAKFVHAPGLVRWDLKKKEAVEMMADVGVIPLEFTPMDDTADEVDSRLPMRQEIACAKKRPLRVFATNPSARDNCYEFPVLKKRRSIQSIDHFSHLSDEIILSIFQWLSKDVLALCARVCSRWRVLSYDESLWKRLDLGKKCLRAGILGMIIERGVSVLRLSMAEVESPIFFRPFSIIEENSMRFSKIQYLDLSSASISEEGLVELFSVCRQLKKLSIEYCLVNEDACSQLSNNKNLEELDMAMCRGLSSPSILKISSSCLKLKSWNLAWTALSSECVAVLSKSIPFSLMRLNLSGLREVNDDDLFKIIRRCRNLVELDISDCIRLTNVSMDNIVNNLNRLEHLHISRCFNIQSQKYMSLALLKSFTHLEVFSTFRDTGIDCIQTLLPDVKINKQVFSTIARPTIGSKRTSIWGMRVRDHV